MTETESHSTASRGRGASHSRKGRPLLSFVLPRVSLGRRRSPVLLSVAGLLALVILAGLGDGLASWGRIHPGVSVGGVAVGGMSLSDARTTLDRELTPRLKLPVTVAYASRRWTVRPSRVSARFPVDTAVRAAFDVGRTGGAGKRVAERFGAWFGRESLPAPVTVDENKLADLFGSLKTSVEVAPRDASVDVSGTVVTRTTAKAGVAVRDSELRADLLSAFLAQHRIVRLAVGQAPVSVTDADAAVAYASARRMVAAGLTLTFSSRSWTIPAARLGDWIGFHKVPFSADPTAVALRETTISAAALASASSAAAPLSPETTVAAGTRMMLVAFVDAQQVAATLRPLITGVGKSAQDARFAVSGGKVRVVPSQAGIGIDVAGLAPRLDTLLRVATAPRDIPFTLAKTQPKLTTEQAKAMGIKQEISSFSTDYAPDNAPRVNNIHTLAKALDGKLVPPGGVFSFNAAVGERTAEKGYQEANAIVNGKLVPQLGGGICQIGSTFFNTVFFAGMPVLERVNHSFYIAHYPKGRDCTVSWGGPDFRWRNDTKAWVLIHTSYDPGTVTISLYGTSPGYKVSYSTSPFTDIVPFGRIKVSDPTLAAGSTVVTDPGVDGRRVVVVRTVTLNGKVVRKDSFTSVYKPKDETVRVGTMVAKPTTSTPAPATKH
jgi:vancomycin resistance protein YoaR